MPSSPENPSLFAQMGGEPALRAVIDDFIERVFADVMIGFFFARADKARIKEKEYELAARLLGADVAYTGLGLPEAHGKHPILGAHFDRRLRILRETLNAHAVPTAVADALLEHSERMRSSVTQQAKGECDHTEVGRRLPLAHAAMVKTKEPAAVAPAAPKRRELPLVGAPPSKRKLP
jgi:hemoglobin